jgi:hypothetical protein
VKSELLAKSPMLALPLVALFLFIAVFVGMVIVTMKRRPKAFDPLARLPFEDDQPTDSGIDAERGAHT